MTTLHCDYGMNINLPCDAVSCADGGYLCNDLCN